MKRNLFALAVLCSAALALVPQAANSQQPNQPLGPGDQGATFRQPWLGSSLTPGTTPPASSQTPNYLQSLLESSGASRSDPTTAGVIGSLQPYDTMGINNDILVTPEVGPWMVLVASYGGKEGPVRGRQMVIKLREVYKLPAYVFNFGAEEKRKELERVMQRIEQQKAALKAQNLSFDQPIRVRHENIQEYCGVLIGGYPTMDAAAKARDQMRTIPFEPKVFSLHEPGDLLDVKYYKAEEGSKNGRPPEAVFVNPFARALPVHNPTTKVERSEEKLDVANLKRLNSEEDFSLFKCKKNYTLVIKQFSLPSFTAPRNEPAPVNFLDAFGLGKKSGENADIAAENAHRFAEGLRKAQLEAYVLHMKYYSLVTVGGFDSLDDPSLRSMQGLLDTRLIPALESQRVEMFPSARPMAVPH